MMKINKYDLFRAILCCIILCECYFFRLLTIPARIYILIYIILTAIVYILSARYYRNTFTYKYIVTFLTIILLDFIYSILLHSGLKISTYFNYNKHYILLLLVPSIIYIIDKDKCIDKLLLLISNVTTINLMLVTAHAFIYNTFSYEILNLSYYSDEISRAGRLRVWDLSSLEMITCIYLFHRILYEKKKIRSLLKLTICLIALVYVEQTRTIIAILVLVASLELFLYSGRTHTSKKLINIIKAIAIFGLLAGSMSLITLLINYFTSVESSVTIRLAELKYAVSPLLDGELLGMGLVDKSFLGTYFFDGSYRELSVTDIGIFGLLYQLGVLVIPLYIWPMIRMARILLKGRKVARNEYWTFLVGIYIYLFATSFTIIILNRQRFLAWPICLALFEYYNLHYLKNQI